MWIISESKITGVSYVPVKLHGCVLGSYIETCPEGKV